MKISNARPILFICLISTVFSCKKKEETSQQQQTSVIVPTYNPTYIDGLLELQYDYWLINDTMKLDGVYLSALINKSSTHRDSTDYYNLQDVGLVSCNQLSLEKGNYNIYNFYRRTPSILKPITWKIGGKAGFDSLSYTDSTPNPIYNGIHKLPDTIFFSKNIIEISGYKGVDKIEVNVMDDRGMISRTKTIHYPTQFVVFDGSDFETISRSDGYVFLVLVFYKNNYQMINGKILNFRTRMSVTKSRITYNPWK